MTAYKVKMADFIEWLLADESQRPEGWENLHAEYISLRENKGVTFMLLLSKEIVTLKAKYQSIETCIKMLALSFDNKLISQYTQLKEILRLYNIRFPLPMDNAGQFSANLKAIGSLNKKNVQQWEKKEKELKEYQEKHAGKEWTKKDFYVWAITLGEHFKQRIDLDVITVAEWVIMINKYESYCEVVNAQNNSKKYGRK